MMEKLLTGLCLIVMFVGILTVIGVVATSKAVEAGELDGYPGDKHE